MNPHMSIIPTMETWKSSHLNFMGTIFTINRHLQNLVCSIYETHATNTFEKSKTKKHLINRSYISYNIHIHNNYIPGSSFRGAEWTIRGAYTPSLRVQTAPSGRCWYIYTCIIFRKSPILGCNCVTIKTSHPSIHPSWSSRVPTLAQLSSKTSKAWLLNKAW